MSNRSGHLLGATLVVLLLLTSLFIASDPSAAPLPGGSLDPLTIPKFVTPLEIPPEMPTSVSPDATFTGKYYEIAVRQFTQQILPAGFPATTVWGYGSVNHPSTLHYPASTIEATVDSPVRVKWINDLKDSAGNFLPHLLPVDQTLHWANPPGDLAGRDTRGTDPARYTGPVPIVTHVHGAHVDPESDGYPEAWYLPAATNIPVGYATQGTRFGQLAGAPAEPGAAVFQYRNDQRATTLWFHDHTLGLTRLNVYAGPAGFYLLRGGAADLPSEPATIGGLPGPAPTAGDAPGTKYYEIPIVIQDRSFNADGSLFYADSRLFFDGFAGPYVGDPTFPSDTSPIWNPEFFGNTMVVNGKTWPFLEVEPRKYRFRFLNGSDSRFLILTFDRKLPFTQIGSDGGFLPAPVVLNQLLLGLAERADVIVDFSSLAPGSVLTLLNVGPDSPFGRLPVQGVAKADPATTGQVMQFRVVPLAAPDTSLVPPLPPLTALGPATTIRQVSLNELESSQVCVDKNMAYAPGVTPPACGKKSVPLAPLEAQLGTVDPTTGLGVPNAWMDPITESPLVGDTETWEIHNFTEDAHPIHLHQVMFQVVDRTPLGAVIGGKKARGPEPWETGFKDTVIAYPGEVTRIKAMFDIPGLYVWHCHILSHEDNEMMRPLCVGGTCP